MFCGNMYCGTVCAVCTVCTSTRSMYCMYNCVQCVEIILYGHALRIPSNNEIGRNCGHSELNAEMKQQWIRNNHTLSAQNRFAKRSMIKWSYARRESQHTAWHMAYSSPDYGMQQLGTQTCCAVADVKSVKIMMEISIRLLTSGTIEQSCETQHKTYC
jgi:hypothetical protein